MELHVDYYLRNCCGSGIAYFGDDYASRDYWKLNIRKGQKAENASGKS